MTRRAQQWYTIRHWLADRLKALSLAVSMAQFKKLEVWQKAHLLALAVYRATTSFPREEQCGLTAQLRRAAGSVPANIAEGCGRRGDGEFARFLRIAVGSVTELEYHCLLVKDLGLLERRVAGRLINEAREIQKMLSGLLHYLRTERIQAP